MPSSFPAFVEIEAAAGRSVLFPDQVVRDHETRVFYVGQPERWTNWPAENKSRRTSSAGSVYPAQTALATIPTDGFAALETADVEMPGAVMTIPIRPSAAPIGLEVSRGNALPGRNRISVDALNSAGHPIGNRPPARIHVGGSGVPVDLAPQTALPADQEFRLRFGIHGAARLIGFSLVNAQARA